MKRFISLFSVLPVVFAIISLAACKPGGDTGGIHFFDGASWQMALNKARTEKKPLFVDIYATWCGPCKMLKKNTFTDKEVGDYFNAHFISLSLDGEMGDGAVLAAQYRISGYPTLIVFNPEGFPVSMETGFLEPADLLDFGKQSVAKVK